MFGDPLYSLHVGFCRMAWSQTRKISQKELFFPKTARKLFRVPIRKPNPFQRVGVFAVQRPCCGDRVDRYFTKGVQMGRHFVVLLVWVASCAPHRSHTSVSICTTASLFPTPGPALTKHVSKLYPRGGLIKHGIREEVSRSLYALSQ